MVTCFGSLENKNGPPSVQGGPFLIVFAEITS